MSNKGLDEALKYFGTKTNMAKCLGVSKMVVHHWFNRRLPEKHAIRIHMITDGKIALRDLIPHA